MALTELAHNLAMNQFKIWLLKEIFLQGEEEMGWKKYSKAMGRIEQMLNDTTWH